MALGLREDGRLGGRRLELLALGHELQRRGVRGRRVVRGERAEGFERGRGRQVRGHLREGGGGDVGRVLVALRDGRGWRRFDMGHGHGGGGEGLLSGRLPAAL